MLISPRPISLVAENNDWGVKTAGWGEIGLQWCGQRHWPTEAKLTSEGKQTNAFFLNSKSWFYLVRSSHISSHSLCILLPPPHFLVCYFLLPSSLLFLPLWVNTTGLSCQTRACVLLLLNKDNQGRSHCLPCLHGPFPFATTPRNPIAWL